MAGMRATEIFDGPGLRLIAIESIESARDKVDTSCRFYASIAPVAVVVCRSNEIYALNMHAEPAVLDSFRRDVPGLDAMIASFNSVKN